MSCVPALTIILCILLYVARSESISETKIYAIYFPQFHADPVNDRLWGAGFTEWDNLNRSRPFNRFNEPIGMPTELGFYNLLDYNIRRRQRELAKEYGIDGFIYHHYWFHHPGEGSILTGMIESMLRDGEPDLPFALNWAKESWVTAWNGRYNPKQQFQSQSEVLYEQVMPPRADDRIVQHYNYLKKYFHHRNYIKIEGCPLFSVYSQDSELPPSLDIIERLKELAMADGFPPPGLHVPLLRMPRDSSFYQNFTTQAEVNEYKWFMLGHPYFMYPFQHPTGRAADVFDSVNYYPYASASDWLMRVPPQCVDKSPAEIAQLDTGDSSSILHKGFTAGILSSFDNTPRRNLNEARIFNRRWDPNRTPGKLLEMDVVTTSVIDKCCQTPEARRHSGGYLSINAWNEWGEGMMLEPSTKYNRTMLEAVREGKRVANYVGCDWEKYHKYMKTTS